MAVPNVVLFAQSDVDTLVAEWRRLAGLLSSLPLVDVSDQGRSISNAAAITKRMDDIYMMIVRAAGPFSVATRMRPGG